MREIGGYIEFDEYYGQEYHKNAIALNSGRHCLEYLIRGKKIRKLFVPNFLCATITETCKKCECKIEYYEIAPDFTPCLPDDLSDDDWIYIINYYGQLSNKIIEDYQKIFENIIVDNAQAFYQYPVENIDTLYTCRKYFGVPDGGYLYTDTSIDEELEIDVSYQRMEYVLGRYELNAGAFFEKAVANNEIFSKEPLKKMSRLTHNLLRRLDYTAIQKKREENYKILYECLQKINPLQLSIPKAPFMYPLFLENGIQIKKRMIDRKIFIPTLWPDVFSIANHNSIAWSYAENILPLPCDQRYSQEDMLYIVDCILKNI